MKLNKTMMIAALIAGGVFTADMAVLAQDSTNKPAAATPAARPPGAQRGQVNIENLARQLTLTDDQKAKVKPVFDDRAQKMADLRQDASLDQAGKRAKMKEINDDVNAKLKDILTAEQYDKWIKMSQRPRRAPGGPGAGGPPPAATTTPPPATDAKPPQ